MRQLVELQENYPAFQALNAEIIAVAQEETDASTLVRAQRFVENQFPMVADPDGTTPSSIKRFGVTLVDREGVVRTLVPGSLSARPRLDMIIDELAKLEGVAAPEITFGGMRRGAPRGTSLDDPSQALDVRWMWSHDKVRPGDDFKLVFLPTVADGYHVYASQENMMSPFKVELQLPEGIVATGPIGYPRGHAFTDPGLKIVLQIYEGDIPMGTFLFKAAEDLSPGTLEVVVKVHFQACDDRACFAPAVKTLRLPVHIAEAGTERTGVVNWQSW